FQMKWISLSIPLLLCATTLAQSKTEKEEYIDSLQKVVNTTTSDSIRIETYYVWDELIYIEDPDLDFEINEKVAAIAEKNIKSADLSKQQKDYFKACKAKSTNIMGLVLVEYGDYKTAH